MSETRRNRRDFLKASSATAAGLALAGGLDLARSAHAAGSDQLKVALIGCGGRGGGAAEDCLSVQDNLKLVAVADAFENRAKGTARRLRQHEELGKKVDIPDDRVFVGLDAYQKAIDCGVDMVVIAGPPGFRPQHFAAAIKAGKHVFVEKPHAIDPYGIQTLNQAVELAKQKKLGILSGLQSRFHASIRETIQRVLDGQIGEIVTIEENFIRGPYGYTGRPKGMRELEIQYGNQYRFSWLCGDDVTQSLVHNLDRSTWAMKEQPPVRCHGLGGRSSSQNLLGDVFDHHSVVYHYANGVRLYAFCRTTVGCYDENSSVILGSKGAAYPIGGRITGANEWRYSGRGDNPYVEEHRQFLKSIRAGQPLNCGEYMSRSTLVAIMGQLSCYSGREVTWQQVSKSDYCLGPRPEACTWDMAPPTQADANGVYPVCYTPGVTKNV